MDMASNDTFLLTMQIIAHLASWVLVAVEMMVVLQTTALQAKKYITSSPEKQLLY